MLISALFCATSGFAGSPLANLGVTKTALSPTATSGQLIVYTISVTNAGPSSSDVLLTDTLPAGATFVSVSGTGWGCSAAPPVICTRASLAVGSAPPITLQVTAPNVTTSTPITNTATVSALTTSDPNGTNNVSTAIVTVNPSPAIPALSTWALAALGAAVGVAAVFLLRR